MKSAIGRKAASQGGRKKSTGVFISLMKTCVCLMMLFTPADEKYDKNFERYETCTICKKEQGRVVETFPRRPYGKTAQCGIQ